MTISLNTIPELIADIQQGKMVILMDDENRENEGDLIMAAEKVTPDAINFMAKYARGLICLTLTKGRCDDLQLPLMVQDNRTANKTNFTMSIEAATGVTTGISAADRARTIQVAVANESGPDDINQPGHIFPLMAQPGGVLSRAGHTEAGCDLAYLAGLKPAAAIVEIMNDDGSMARRSDLEKFAQEHQLKIGTIADLIHHRSLNEKTVEQISSQEIDTDFGRFQLHIYRDNIHQDLHFALVKGEILPDQPTMVRVHVANAMRDLLLLKTPGQPSWSFHRAMEKIAQEPCGVVILLAGQETTTQMVEQWLNPAKQKEQPPTNVVYRSVGTGSQILRDIGVKKMHLLSSPMKFNAISGFDLEVLDYISVGE